MTKGTTFLQFKSYIVHQTNSAGTKVPAEFFLSMLKPPVTTPYGHRGFFYASRHSSMHRSSQAQVFSSRITAPSSTR